MQGHHETLHSWLGIPPEEQPPNHYRLLGVPNFCQDTSAIRKAYSGRLEYLHKKAHEDPEAAHRVQMDVRHAAECLIDAGSRAAYDAQLRQSLGLPPLPGPNGQVVMPGTPVSAGPPEWLWPALLGGLCLGLLVVGFVGMQFLRGKPTVADASVVSPEEPASPETPPANETPTPETPKTVLPETPKVETPVVPETTKVAPAPKPNPPAPRPAAVRPAPKPRVETPREEENPFKVVEPAPRTIAPAPPIVIRIRETAPVEPGAELTPSNPPASPGIQEAPITPAAELPGSSNVTIGPPAFPMRPAPAPIVAPAPVAAPAAGGASSVTPVASFADLPEAALLPSAIVQGERAIVAWSQAIAGDPELSLLTDAAQLAEGQAISLQRVAEKVPPQWRVYVTSPNTAPAPLAQFTLDNRELRFQWAKDIKGLPFEQLANCLVKLRSGGQTQSIALREPIKKEVANLSLGKKIETMTFDVGGIPKLDTLHLMMLADPTQWPAPAKFRKGSTFAKLGQPVVMEFEDLEGVTIEYRLTRKGEGLAVLIQGRVKDPSGDEIELTTERMTSLRNGTESALADAKEDIVVRSKELIAYQYRYANAQAMPAGNLTEVQQKKVALDTLQGNIKVTNGRINSLRKRIPLLERRLSELPKLELIVRKLHEQVSLPLKIVAALESDEIVLVDASQGQ